MNFKDFIIMLDIFKYIRSPDFLFEVTHKKENMNAEKLMCVQDKHSVVSALTSRWTIN